MIDSKSNRRFLAALMVLVGALLIFLAPDNAWIGAVLAALGFGIEGVAMVLIHRGKTRDH